MKLYRIVDGALEDYEVLDVASRGTFLCRDSLGTEFLCDKNFAFQEKAEAYSSYMKKLTESIISLNKSISDLEEEKCLAEKNLAKIIAGISKIDCANAK